MSNDTATDVAAARRLLELARHDLDDTVATLPGMEGEKAMATPALLAMLLRVVKAKRHLSGLEMLLATEDGLAVRTATLPLQ